MVDIVVLGIVSPHFDDAVLSCGQLLSANKGSHVVTVFSSGPKRVDPLPWWDQMCGVFQPGDDVMSIRQQEDDDALALAAATGHRLGFFDGQYRTLATSRLHRLRVRVTGANADRAAAKSDLSGAMRRDLAAMVAALAQESDVRTWLAPLGLHRGDHELVAEVCVEVAHEMPRVDWLIYEELPYRSERPELVEAALVSLAARGVALEPTELTLDLDLSHKRSLIECHRSQLGALAERVEVAVTGPEVFHRMAASG